MEASKFAIEATGLLLTCPVEGFDLVPPVLDPISMLFLLRASSDLFTVVIVGVPTWTEEFGLGVAT
jgi:hypothetical protein